MKGKNHDQLDDKSTLEIINSLCHTDYASLDDIPVDVLDMVCGAMETWLQVLESQGQAGTKDKYGQAHI